MAKIFYDHLINLTEITQELGRYEVEMVELDEILKIADETIHLRVLDVILTHLPKHKHEEFLMKLHHAPHDEKLLEYLEIEADRDISSKIKEEAEKTKKEILREIQASKKK